MFFFITAPLAVLLIEHTSFYEKRSKPLRFLWTLRDLNPREVFNKILKALSVLQYSDYLKLQTIYKL